MLKRKIERYLVDFFKKSKKSLLITGARQIGKTFSIREYGKNNFDCFVEINFIDMPEAKELIKNANSSKDILLRLSALSNSRLKPGHTLIFFDEVQECPEIVTAIKFLVDEGSYKYILSGSMLGVELQDIRSIPVGYMSIKEMFPLDFEEFLTAIGIDDKIITTIKKSWEEKIPVDEVLHKRLMQIFRLYLIVGGMPDAVNAYIKTNNLQNVFDAQNDILQLYKKDIAKYDKDNKLYIDEIFQLIPPELNAKNKRFILKNMNENRKFSYLENSFLWLRDAGVALPVYNVEEPKMPLLLSRSRSLFKLFQYDVGLLAAQYAKNIQIRILNDEKDINFGAIYENVVAQELRAHGFELYYYNNKRHGELDFLIESDDNVLPIEVKSGKNYALHRALSNIMEISDYNLKEALVLCNDNLLIKNKIYYVPIYMVMFIQKNTTMDFVYKIDTDAINQLSK